jgi:Heme/copper-type cytochrome/quinol oxidases, subunit 1
MVDSKLVLTGQTIAYTLYCLVIILLVAWFAIKVTGKGKSTAVKPALFYTFVSFLTLLGLSLHIIIARAALLVELVVSWTVWSHHPLKFLLGGLLGFALAVPAGIMQADVGLNRILHNTQWVIGPHVHVAVLVGLTMTLYAAIYLLFPILTNGAVFYSKKLVNVHFWCHLIGGVGMGAFMGMAGLKGVIGIFTPAKIKTKDLVPAS